MNPLESNPGRRPPDRLMESDATVWIVCPVYFDTASFKILTGKLADALSVHRRLRFLLVDDSGGEDPGLRGFEGVHEVEILSMTRRQGHQAAITNGLRHLVPRLGDRDIVVTMDADGEDPPEGVPFLLAALQPGAGLAIATRSRRREGLTYQLAYRLYRIGFRMLTGVDMKSGNFAAMTAVFLKRWIGDARFDLCYSSTLLSLPVEPALVPTDKGVRYDGASRMSFWGLIKHARQMLLPFRRGF